MKEEEFNNIFENGLKELNMSLSKEQLGQFYKYMNILLEWNKVINLTTITKPEEIILKHFIDSLTILKHIEKKDKIIDVGTGAGFPGIPIKIAFPETTILLLDSLNKRIKFLNEVISKLNLSNIETIHGRAEDYGRDKKYREMYDISLARAVAPLNILVEYLMPFIKKGGKCICMKSYNIDEEINLSREAINILGGKFISSDELILPNSDIKRKIIKIKKIKNTNIIYPRKSGIPAKQPL